MAASTPVSTRVKTLKRLEDKLSLIWGDSWAVIVNGHVDMAVRSTDQYGYAAASVANCILDKV